MKPGYRDFEFDLPGALLVRLVGVLDELPAAPLAIDSLEDIPEAQGVYQLFINRQLVYIGKTDAEAGLKSRLKRHHKKIQHRIGLDPSSVFFKAVRIYVFTAVDLETQLIEYYGGFRAVRWNGSGFGSNDPGRERDTTTYKEDHFDAMYPIDIGRTLNIDFPINGSAATILTTLKNNLPYVLRFQSAGPRSRQPHPDLVNTQVVLPANARATAATLLSAVVPQLPPGWQAVKLPSHVILYKEDRDYPQGTVISRSSPL